MEKIRQVINDRYEILDVVGKGGMSTVYLAKDLTLTNKLWALKRVSYSEATNEKAKRQLEAFEKEVELLTTLSHPDIPRIVDRIKIGDELYVCMDLIEGNSLFDEYEKNGIFEEGRVIDIAIQLCDILIYLHEVRENPIVYRDIKIDNIMIERDRIKLIDFGIAKECKRGVNITDKLGTRTYAAPEQYLQLPQDERTDIYALGSTLYQLLTGTVPSLHPHEFPNLRSQNPKCSEGLEYIIHKCIQERPQQRYKNCHELKKDLLNIDTLNSGYREKMQGRLIKFTSATSIFIAFIIMTSFGYGGVVEAKRDNYLYYMDEALSYQQQNQLDLAEKKFIEATKYNPKSLEPYIYLLDMYQLKEGNREELIKESILTVERLVEDKNSKVYNNPEIMYRLAKLCFEVKSDVNYAVKAYNYFERVKKTNVYDEAEIESYATIAYYNKMLFDKNEEGYTKLAESLQTLEAYTDGINDINTRLDNYYTLTTIYNSYLNQEELDSKERMIAIVDKALDLIANTPEEILEFQDEIILIERIAGAYYTKGVNETDSLLKRSALNEALTYFLQLEEMGVELSETIQLRIGNIYRGIYETYTFEERQNVQNLLSNACSRYESLLKQNNQHLEASIKLTETYLDLELLKSDSSQRNFSRASQQYNQTASISNANKSASFRALKQRMQSYGL